MRGGGEQEDIDLILPPEMRDMHPAVYDLLHQMSCLKDAGGPQFQDLVIKKLELCTSFDHDDVESLAKIA